MLYVRRSWDSSIPLVVIGVVFYWHRYDFLMAWAPHLSLKEVILCVVDEMYLVFDVLIVVISV